MSIFFKAHGTPSIGLLIIRLTVGIYTLSLGIMQASNIEAYIAKVKSMQVLSENTAFIFGFITPFLLIIFGALYIMGFFTPTTSTVLAVVQLVKIFSRGLLIGGAIPFNKDVIILACLLLTLFSGAGVFSFDALLDKKKRKSNVILPVDSSTDASVVKPETESVIAEEVK